MDFELKKVAGTDFYEMTIENGDIKIIGEKEEIQQRIMINLSTFKGENVANPNVGLDYFNNVFPFNAEDVTLQDAFKEIILNTTGVLSLIFFEITQEKETLIVKATVDTEEGDIPILFTSIV